MVEQFAEIDKPTAVDVLGSDHRGLKPANPLIQAGLEIHHTPTPHGHIYTVDFDTDPLDDQGLMRVVSDVAPYKRQFLDIDGVIDDWNLEDRHRANPSEYTAYLSELHAHLGVPWREFALSQPAFLGTLENGKIPSHMQTLRYPGFTPETQLTRYKLLSHHLSGAASSFETVVATLDQLGLKDPKQVVLDAIRQLSNARRHPDRQVRNEHKLARIFNALDKSGRYGLLSRVVNYTESEALEVVARQTREEEWGDVVVDGEAFVFPLSRYAPEVQDAYDNNRTRIKEGNFEATQVELPLASGRTETFVLPGTVERVSSSHILPTISWITDGDGRREFVITRKAEDDDGHVIHHDGVLGVLAVATFAPELVKRWPKKLPIRGSRLQEMGPAQVPVLALMRQGDLLKSAFVERVEVLAKSNST